MSVDVKFTGNSDKVLDAFEEAKAIALEAIGITAERHAKRYETAVDTGYLRNSITWAISGKAAAMSQYSADKPDSHGQIKMGSYDGCAPNDKEKAVYIGTNVSYAVGIETGSHRKAGGLHFLQKAATGHTDEYKKIVKDALESYDL